MASGSWWSSPLRGTEDKNGFSLPTKATSDERLHASPSPSSYNKREDDGSDLPNVRIVVVGDSGAGKTSLLRLLCTRQ